MPPQPGSRENQSAVPETEHLDATLDLHNMRSTISSLVDALLMLRLPDPGKVVSSECRKCLLES